MRYILSYILYFIGDVTSLTIMRLGKGYGWGFYNKIMLWSVDLDSEGRIWKYVQPKKKNNKSKRIRKSK